MTPRFKRSLSKTCQGFFGRIGTLFQANEVTDETWDELEELLIQSDLGHQHQLPLVERPRNRVRKENIKRTEDVRRCAARRTAEAAGPPAADEHRRTPAC